MSYKGRSGLDGLEHGSEEYFQTVLDVVNTGRVAIGLEPLKEIPKGDLSHAYSCPIANSFNDAGKRGVEVLEEGISLCGATGQEELAEVWDTYLDECGFVQLPYIINDFIYNFDAEEEPFKKYLPQPGVIDEVENL